MSEDVDDRPLVAVFRPDDERTDEAIAVLEARSAEPLADPMLAIEPTGASPASDAEIVILTSKTGVECAVAAGWSPGEATLCCIGPRTARAAEAAGWTVELVPDEYTSSGLVSFLEDEIEGVRIEVARSDHGSDVLLEGLEAAGAIVHETILYRLVRPAGAGQSTKAAAAGELDAALFTSSLTVEHFLAAAEERGIESATLEGLDRAVVGAIGDPTAETAAAHGIDVDVVASEATFEILADEVLAELRGRS